MSTHDYTPEQALEVLMQKLGAIDEQLAAEIRAAIDTGKDVPESEPTSRRRKPRIYRKTVPFSYEEALQVAITALRAHFIEQPLFANSCAANMSSAAIGPPRDPRLATFGRSGRSVDLTVQAKGEQKTIMIELQTETQISRSDQGPFPLKTVRHDEIEEEKANLARLRDLLDFSERNNGHTSRS